MNSRLPRSITTIVAGAAVLAVAGCGAGPATSDEALPAPSVAPIPSTTVAEPVGDFACDTPRVIAENLLLERRRGASPASCAPPDLWQSSTDDFVDFTLNPDGDGDTVRFIGHYRTGPSSSTRHAEALRFERDASGAWRAVIHEVVDLTAELHAANELAERYFDALASGDFATAAALLEPRDPTTPRPDLERLETEGLLPARGTDGIAVALAQWCEQGAHCAHPDAVVVQPDADHAMQVIASYAMGPTSFEVAFEIDGDGIVGIPPTW